MERTNFRVERSDFGMERSDLERSNRIPSLLMVIFSYIFFRMYALFNTEQNALSFYSYINIQHPNIKFTMEREENHKFPFLYVLLDNNYSNQGIITLYKR